MVKKTKQEQEADDLRAALLKQKRMDIVEERSTKRQIEFGKNKAKAKAYDDKLEHDAKELSKPNAASYVEWSTALMNIVNALNSAVGSVHTRLSGTGRRFIADKVLTLKERLEDLKEEKNPVDLECDFVVDQTGKVTPELFFQGRSLKELDKLDEILGPIKGSKYKKLQQDVTKRVEESFDWWATRHGLHKGLNGAYEDNNNNKQMTLSDFQRLDNQHPLKDYIVRNLGLRDIGVNTLVIK